MPLFPRRWIGVGWLVAIATGAGSWVAGYPFLTSHTFHFTLPVVGAVHLPSATFFDIGVFALVVGSTLLILTALAHQSVRSHRWHARLQEEAEKQAPKPAQDDEDDPQASTSAKTPE